VSSELHPRDNDDARCPQCGHVWVTHGSVPDANGCMLIMSSMAERAAMSAHADELRRQGVPPEVAGPRAYRELRHCGCLERPEPGSVWAGRLAHEAARQVELYGNV
jgi:hypothetical protein